ncbi:hypothetical protein BaRGS_00020255 [Batillaria attramentaria]|uniref:Reverse transcriptase RNase H-like domain-containing protein n=1 Tax=Batillaria attramentaria TaxID=370345 RepID=A0ABD0KNK8_9CAEN
MYGMKRLGAKLMCTVYYANSARACIDQHFCLVTDHIALQFCRAPFRPIDQGARLPHKRILHASLRLCGLSRQGTRAGKAISEAAAADY